MPDKIIVEGLLVHGRHGWRRHLETHPQPFHVNAELHLDMSRVAQTDDLADTIDYAAVCEEVGKLVEGTSFAMIESLAHAIALMLLNMGADHVKLRVAKPGVALIHGAKTVAIEIERSRNSLANGGLGDGTGGLATIAGDPGGRRDGLV